MVILVLGLPGSGKSYFAARLSKMTNTGYLNSDRVRKEIFEKRTYEKEEKDFVYNFLLDKMSTTVNEGKSLIIDATFSLEEIRKQFINKMKGRESIYFIEVWANEEIIKKRLKKSRPYSEADFEVYQLIKNNWEPLNEPHLKLESTDDNIDEMLQKAATYLKLKDDKKTDQ